LNDTTNENRKDFRTSIGGQALIEGILMRGPKKQSIVVRTKDGLVEKTEELRLTKDRHPIAGWPLFRGVVNFGASMAAGVRALMYAAELSADGAEDAPPESKLDKWIEKRFGAEKAEKLAVYFAVALGAAMSIGLFMLLPTFLAGFITVFTSNPLIKNLVEGLLRIAIFIGYIALASLLPDMRRVWQYHGAEHKTIACYEAGLPLSAENVRPQPRCHPRCGTSFMFIVMIVSILVFSVVRWGGVLPRIALRLVLLPVVVAVSYELIKYAGRRDNLFTRAVSAPGKALQRLTTREPDDDMIEVAIAAVNNVLPEREGEDEW
jgi:uncharacterized protein YqhQ